ARLEGEDEATTTVHVDGLTRNPAGHAPQVLFGGAEEAERRAAVVEPVAEGLALPNRDVGTALARRLEDGEGDRVAADDQQSAVPLRGGAQRLDILARPQEVRLLEEAGGGLVVGRRCEGGSVGDPADKRDLDELGAVPGAIGQERLPA